MLGEGEGHGAVCIDSRLCKCESARELRVASAAITDGQPGCGYTVGTDLLAVWRFRLLQRHRRTVLG